MFPSRGTAVVDTSADPALMQVNRCVPGPAKASIPKARRNGSPEAIVAPGRAPVIESLRLRQHGFIALFCVLAY
jgi:hypothetical protein